MSGHATHAARPGIVHHSAQHLALFVVFGGSDLGPPGRGRQKAGVRHLQRGEDFPGAVLIERGSGHAFHQRTQRDEVGVAIEEARTGRVYGFFGKRQTETGVPALPGRIQIKVFTQAGEVRQQVADGDVVFAVLGEFRECILPPDRSPGLRPFAPVASPLWWWPRLW